MAAYLFPSSVPLTPGADATDSGSTTGLTVGVTLIPLVGNLLARGIRFYGNRTNASGTVTPYLYDSVGTQLATGPAVTIAAGAGWTDLPFTTPYLLTAATTYKPAVFLPVAATQNYTAGSGLASAVTTPQFQTAATNGGFFNYGTTAGISGGSFAGTGASWYGVDINAADTLANLAGYPIQYWDGTTTQTGTLYGYDGTNPTTIGSLTAAP